MDLASGVLWSQALGKAGYAEANSLGPGLGGHPNTGCLQVKTSRQAGQLARFQHPMPGQAGTLCRRVTFQKPTVEEPVWAVSCQSHLGANVAAPAP